MFFPSVPRVAVLFCRLRNSLVIFFLNFPFLDLRELSVDKEIDGQRARDAEYVARDHVDTERRAVKEREYTEDDRHHDEHDFLRLLSAPVRRLQLVLRLLAARHDELREEHRSDGDHDETLLGMESYLCFIGVEYGIIYFMAILMFYISCLSYFIKRRHTYKLYSDLGIAIICMFILFLIFAWVGGCWFFVMPILGYIMRNIYFK